MELLSDNGEFSKTTLKSEIYQRLNDTFSGRPMYYNNESKRYVYSTEKGFWVVIPKQNKC